MGGRHYFYVVESAGLHIQRDDNQPSLGMLLLESLEASQVFGLYFLA